MRAEDFNKILRAKELDASFEAANEPLDMLIAENNRLWEAINTLQRENLKIMLKLNALQSVSDAA